ncbi:aldehyde dehydrogenase family protein [Mycolicibacterium murale]|uniref:aldehyde dehydrogenase family protein n=1 Tax=Mycolicibacterium murale TaxID=182220 RepID=UPI0018758DA1|nr:aldehyde dehydrogenase family protein [Mycolicibacterium murale]MCV7185926.1 aldehyde dehydrogenase [Mycolicibacterium murale]
MNTSKVNTVVNPATEEVIDEYLSTDASSVDAALRNAALGQREWASLRLSDRRDGLRAIADMVTEHIDELASLESLDVGKPISRARNEIASVAQAFHYYSGMVDKICGSTIPVDGGIDMTFREPLGVVAVIAPWNFPLAVASWNAAAALAAGNAVVVKPAEDTPLSTRRFAELMATQNLPEHLVQVVLGPGPTVGEMLTSHPLVRKISFTGSTKTGKAVMRSAADTMKRLTLELGGKSASIIFADSDLERAIAEAPMGVFDNTGQDCCARSRILVERTVFTDFVDGFIAATAELRIGAPADEMTELGPLASRLHHERVQAFLDPVEGAVVAGEIPDGPGFWMAPHIVIEPDRRSAIVNEEVFGPVAVVLPFDDEEDAIELANSTIYGLSGSIWTSNLGRALRVAQRVESGTLSVNSNTSVRLQTPFGGFKESGFGRELGMAAIDGYTELKNVFIAT